MEGTFEIKVDGCIVRFVEGRRTDGRVAVVASTIGHSPCDGDVEFVSSDVPLHFESFDEFRYHIREVIPSYAQETGIKNPIKLIPPRKTPSTFIKVTEVTTLAVMPGSQFMYGFKIPMKREVDHEVIRDLRRELKYYKEIAVSHGLPVLGEKPRKTDEHREECEPIDQSNAPAKYRGEGHNLYFYWDAIKNEVWSDDQEIRAEVESMMFKFCQECGHWPDVIGKSTNFKEFIEYLRKERSLQLTIGFIVRSLAFHGYVIDGSRTGSKIMRTSFNSCCHVSLEKRTGTEHILDYPIAQTTLSEFLVQINASYHSKRHPLNYLRLVPDSHGSESTSTLWIEKFSLNCGCMVCNRKKWLCRVSYDTDSC